MLPSILVSPLSLSFLDTYSLLTSFLWCKTLCIVFSFLVLWSFCLSSSLVYIKNGCEYLMIETALVFIPFIKFQLYSFVFSSFLLLRWNSFLIFFFHLHLFDGVCFQFSLVFVGFLFSKHSNFSWFISSIPSIMCHFPCLVIRMKYFSITNSNPVLTVYFHSLY